MPRLLKTMAPAAPMEWCKAMGYISTVLECCWVPPEAAEAAARTEGRELREARREESITAYVKVSW